MTTHTWFGGSGTATSPSNWTPTGTPGSGDTAIATSGTLFLPVDANLEDNLLEIGSATLSFVGDQSLSFMVPTLDQATVVTNQVPGAATPETTVVDSSGVFVNQGTIVADGPLGSTFTLNLAANGTLPGYFIDYGEIDVDAGNSMTINVGVSSPAELLDASAIYANGGSLFVNVGPSAIAGGIAPIGGAFVIDGGGTLETNAGYPSSVNGVSPFYAFADATAGNTLKIDNVGSFGGIIIGFGVNDTIDLGASLAVTQANYSGTSGILSLENSGGTVLASLLLGSGSFSGSSFTIGTGSDGDTILTTSVQNAFYNNTSGTWQTAGNWSNGIPGPSDAAVIGIGASAPFDLTTGSAAVQVGALVVVGKESLLQITSSTSVGPYSINAFGGTVEVTSGETLAAVSFRSTGGTLEIDPTAVVDLAGHVVTGAPGADNGTLTVANTNTSAIRLFGGSIDVDGGVLNAGTGQANGNGGAIQVGYLGGSTPANFTVENSGANIGTVTDTYALLSSDPTSFGVLTLDGPGASWTDEIDPHDATMRGFMDVGYNNQAANSGTLVPSAISGTATLVVENGATLTEQNNAAIGATTDSSGSATITSGATWNVASTGGFTSGGLAVGAAGEGVLAVLGTAGVGGTVDVGTNGIGVGVSSTANGTLIVNGAGALVDDAGGMNDGVDGSGLIEALNGGTIELTGTRGISLGTSAGPGGTLIVGGTDTSTGASALISLGTVARGIGVGVVSNGTVEITTGGTIEANGTSGVGIGQTLGITGVVTVTGPDALLNVGTAASGMSVGGGGQGILDVAAGGIVTIMANGLGIGIGSTSSTGTVDVSGSNSTLAVLGNGAINVGSPGKGLLEIDSGASVVVSNGVLIANGSVASSGTVTLDGGTLDAAGEFSVGNFGAGSLVVENGGLLDSTGTFHAFNIGFNAGSDGFVSVSDGAIIDNTGTGAGIFSVGETNGATGILQIGTLGTLVTSGVIGQIGAANGGTAIATVSDGLWTAGQLIIGSAGTGSLDINSHGVVNAGTNFVTLGQLGGSDGIVTLEGDGTLTTASGVVVGSSGTGQLGISSGAQVSVTGNSSVNVGFNAGSSGTIVINGGTLTDTAGGGFFVGGTNASGAVVVEGGGALNTGTSFGFTDVNATGTATASAVVSGGTWVSNGSIIVGDTGAGSLDINSGGLVKVSNSSLEIGNQTGGAGTVSLESGGSLIANAVVLDAGGSQGATGQLSIAGGTVAASSLQMNTNGTINVSSGSLSVSGTATIGQFGTGVVFDETGGAVTTQGLSIAGVNGSATLTVSGASFGDTGELSIGNGGSAFVTIEAGGVFTATTAVPTFDYAIGSSSGGTADVVVNAATFTTAGEPLLIGAASLLVENNGTFSVTSSGGGPVIDISATGTAQASVTVTGTGSAFNLNAPGSAAQLIIGDSGNGELTIDSGAVVDASGNTVDIGNGSGSFSQGTVMVNGGTLEANTLVIALIHGAGGTLTVGSGGLVQAGSISDGGIISLAGGVIDPAASIQVNTSGTIIGFGTLDASVANSDLVASSGGTLEITGSVTGNGTLNLGSGSTLLLDSQPGANPAVTFNSGSPETLIVNAPSIDTSGPGPGNFSSVDFLATGDRIELGSGIVINSVSLVSNGGTTNVDLAVSQASTSGSYVLNNVTFSGSANGFTIGTDSATGNAYIQAEQAVCFARGTRIMTPSGEKPVEELAAGDTVLTFDGKAETIVWIGAGRMLVTPGHRSPATPVIIRKDALAEDVPCRDLRVTKGHSLYLDGVLIPAEFLVNYRSIVWDDQAREIEIHHIELGQHGVLIANGAPAESYRDDGNRWLFHTGNAGWNLPPQPPCAPVLTGGSVVDAVWRCLLDRAGQVTMPPLTDDPDVHLLIDGRRCNPIERRGGVCVFRLPARPRVVRIRSRSVVPQALGIARDDRRLGVAVQRIVVAEPRRQRAMAAADASLTDGFHLFEEATDIRWTNGDALIPPALFARMSSAGMLMLHLGAATRYIDERVAVMAA